MKEQGRKVAEMGGLHIVGTERHESRRVDNQLRGRAGRQGDPGSSKFYLSLEDELMRLFGGERLQRLMNNPWLGMQDGEALESNMLSKQIQNAQRKVEEYHFEQRKSLLEYDEVMDHQRKRTYGARQSILDGRNPRSMLLGNARRATDRRGQAVRGRGLRRGELRCLRLRGDGHRGRAVGLPQRRLPRGGEDRPGPRQPGRPDVHLRSPRREPEPQRRPARLEVAGTHPRRQHPLRPQAHRPRP